MKLSRMKQEHRSRRTKAWPLALALATAPTFSDANWMSMNPYVAGADSSVFTAAVDGSANLYIAGSFSAVGDIVASYIAKWDGTRWSAIGSGIKGGVSSLAVSGSDLYVGGQFTAAGGIAA